MAVALLAVAWCLVLSGCTAVTADPTATAEQEHSSPAVTSPTAASTTATSPAVTSQSDCGEETAAAVRAGRLGGPISTRIADSGEAAAFAAVCAQSARSLGELWRDWEPSGFEGATPTGTGFNNVSTTLPSGAPANLLLPARFGTELVVYVHGKGGGADQLATTTGWAGLRRWLIDRRLPVVETTAADDWGADASRTAYSEAIEWARSVVPGTRLIVIGHSMGALTAYWLASADTSVTTLVISSGTTDLARRYRVATGGDRRSLNLAYGLPPGSHDQQAFAAASSGHDPMLMPLDSWAGVDVLQVWGNKDTSVPPQTNGEAWVRAFGPHTAGTTVKVRKGGTHDLGTGSPSQARLIIDWLAGHV